MTNANEATASDAAETPKPVAWAVSIAGTIGRNDFYLGRTAAEIDTRGVGRELVPLYAGKDVEALHRRLVAIRHAMEPVLDWYQSDEEPHRPLVDVLTEAVSDLRQDRAHLLKAISILRRLHEAGNADPHAEAWMRDLIGPALAAAESLTAKPGEVMR